MNDKNPLTNLSLEQRSVLFNARMEKGRTVQTCFHTTLTWIGGNLSCKKCGELIPKYAAGTPIFKGTAP